MDWSRFNWILFWRVLTGGMLLWALQGVVAWIDQWFTPRQIVERGLLGLPLRAHGGWWSDFFLITPTISFLVAFYGADWWTLRAFGDVAAGFVATWLMHETYRGVKYSEAHVECGPILKGLQAKGRLKVPGWIHFCYMWPCFSVLSRFYFREIPETEILLVGAVSLILIVHVITAQHAWLRIVDHWWWPVTPLEDAGAWGAIIGTIAFLFVRADVLMALRK